MSKNLSDRIARLMPNGVPKWVRVYDNGGPDKPDGTVDRFTVVFTGNYRRRLPNGQWDCDFQHVGMSGSPFHPQGFCQHGEHDHQIDVRKGWAPAMGRRCHLGKRIAFEDLPADCQKVVVDDYMDLWELKEKAA